MFHIFLHCYYFHQIKHRRNNFLLNFFQYLNKILLALVDLILLIDYFYLILFLFPLVILHMLGEENDKKLECLLEVYLKEWKCVMCNYYWYEFYWPFLKKNENGLWMLLILKEDLVGVRKFPFASFSWNDSIFINILLFFVMFFLTINIQYFVNY